MWGKIRLREIKEDAIKSLQLDFNGREEPDKKNLRLFYYVIPFLFAIALIVVGAKVDSDIANYFITGISIFAGLFFNLLLVIADKLNQRKRLLDESKDEEIRKYIERYRHFSEQLISQISYSIVISIWIILLMFLTHLEKWINDFFILTYRVIDYLIPILNFVIFYFGMKFIILLFVILSSMYVMLLDDIKIKKD